MRIKIIFLRDWAKDKVQKKYCRGIEQVREARKRKIKPFLLELNTKQYTKTTHKLDLSKPKTIALSRI